MDYEKKYKEALERAKYLKENTDSVGALDISACFEQIFPELRESEDERIKKGLIKGLSAMRDIHKHQTFSDDAINIDDAIAWLEKQGERKTPQWMIDFLDSYRRKIGCSLDYDEARDVDGRILCIKEWLEKQGEQKSWSEEDEKSEQEQIEELNELIRKLKNNGTIQFRYLAPRQEP